MSVLDILTPDKLMRANEMVLRMLLAEEKAHLRDIRRASKKEGKNASSGNGQGKQAKTLTDDQCRIALEYLRTTQNPERDAVMFCLSRFAGLRSIEITNITWGMLTDPQGAIAEAIALENKAGKGNYSGRVIPMAEDLWYHLDELSRARPRLVGAPWKADDKVIYSVRGESMSDGSVTIWFLRLYKELGFVGCSSHSGRRTFATETYKILLQNGGTLKDLQDMMGHKNLATTQRYIEGDSDAKRKAISKIGLMGRRSA